MQATPVVFFTYSRASVPSIRSIPKASLCVPVCSSRDGKFVTRFSCTHVPAANIQYTSWTKDRSVGWIRTDSTTAANATRVFGCWYLLLLKYGRRRKQLAVRCYRPSYPVRRTVHTVCHAYTLERNMLLFACVLSTNLLYFCPSHWVHRTVEHWQVCTDPRLCSRILEGRYIPGLRQLSVRDPAPGDADLGKAWPLTNTTKNGSLVLSDSGSRSFYLMFKPLL